MQKYVLDTNVLLQNFQSLFAFDTEETIIPLVVLEELDKHKKHEKLGHNARQVARYLDKLSKRGDVTQGVELNNGGILKVVSVSDYYVGDLELDASNDNKIIATAHSEDAILISNDVLVRVKARGLGITAESYDPEEVRNLDTEYRGVVKLDLTFDEESTVTQEGFKTPQSEDKGIFANTYATLRTGLNSSRLVRYDASESMFKPFNVPKSVMGIEPRSTEQKYLLNALLDPSISLVTVKGKSGSGKTLMAIAAALEMVLEKEMYTKIIVTRAVEPMGRDIGYLPGTMEEKLGPWVKPVFDNIEYILGDKPNNNGVYSVEDLKEQGVIEIEALTYIRGRTLPNQIILLDECQNLSIHEVRTILTRAGEGSKVIMLGDVEQIDSPYLDSHNNGLSYVVDKFKNEPIAAHITLEKCERSELAEKAVELL